MPFLFCSLWRLKIRTWTNCQLHLQHCVRAGLLCSSGSLHTVVYPEMRRLIDLQKLEPSSNSQMTWHPAKSRQPSSSQPSRKSGRSVILISGGMMLTIFYHGESKSSSSDSGLDTTGYAIIFLPRWGLDPPTYVLVEMLHKLPSMSCRIVGIWLPRDDSFGLPRLIWPKNSTAVRMTYSVQPIS